MEQRLQNLSEKVKLSPEGRERIRARLASQQVSQEVISVKKKTLYFRKPLLAAALAAVMIVTAFAVEFGVGWENFMGRRPSEEAVTSVGESAVTGDYTLTLQEAIVDDTGAAFLLALTRNDGGVLEGDPRLSGNIYHWDVKVDGERPNMSMNTWRPIPSEDGKTVYYCVEFESQQPGDLLGKTVSFTCDGVADLNWSQEEIQKVRRETVSLAPLAQTTGRMDMSCEEVSRGEYEPELVALVEDLSARATVPLTRLGEGETRISALLFTNDGPVVAVDWNRGLIRQGEYLTSGAMAIALTDTRTGESWGYRSAALRRTAADGQSGFYLSEFKGCPLTEEDLPYVEVTVGYTMEKVLSDQEVELSFSAGVGRQMALTLDRDLDFFHYGSCSAHVTEARVSALRLRLIVDRQDREGWEMDRSAANTRWALEEKDGNQVLLQASPNHFDEELGTGWIELTGQNENGDRILLDPDQIEALLVGDVRIPLT